MVISNVKCIMVIFVINYRRFSRSVRKLKYTERRQAWIDFYGATDQVIDRIAKKIQSLEMLEFEELFENNQTFDTIPNVWNVFSIVETFLN